MNRFAGLVSRNLKIYLRDKSAVFFSLIAMFIVIILMVVFLGDMNVNAITEILESFGTRDTDADVDCFGNSVNQRSYYYNVFNNGYDRR